jgi:sRNA-binding carbon storage regulator CsrA
MLVVSRKENESIRIEPVDGLDPALTLREAFASGAIVVRLQHVGHKRVRLLIEAPPALKIMRSETASADSSAEAEQGSPLTLVRGERR